MTVKQAIESSDIMHWADKAAERVIQTKGNRKAYTVAAGITPSGTVHIGNFREIITVDLVKRALESLGKKVRFLYSWDEYDVFRKVPADAPKKDVLEKYLRYPITEVPDTYDNKHQSYAEHNEKEVEDTIPLVNICPEFIYQAKKYLNCDYAEEIKHALETRNDIKKILDKYRTEEKGENWWPVSIFCDKCKKDTTRVLGWDGKYSLTYECDCGHRETFDFRKKGITKLPWRIDWPMRWHYEKVDFEPSGKEHSTPGGSRTTGDEIFQLLYKEMSPLHLKYDFITIKGTGGKISKSLGNVVSLKDTLDIYEPEIVRWLFAGTRPDTEFAISFDVDVVKVYEDFDTCERIAFGKQEASEKEKGKQRRIYELSCVGSVPKEMPIQPGFRHLTMMLQIFGGDIQKVGLKCDQMENDKNKEMCFDGLARQIHPITHGSVSKVFELCGLMPSFKWNNYCVGVNALSSYGVGDRISPFELCANIHPGGKRSCYDKLFSIMKAYKKGGEDLKKLCSQISDLDLRKQCELVSEP